MYKTIGKKFRRALHFDFHTPPTIDNIFGNFDAEHFADQLADAHVEYINFFARCNMGFSYYNTKVGKKYEGLGDRDVLKEVIDACHKRSIGVTAYLNIGLDHEFAADNPGWNKILKDGRVYKDDKSDNFFRVMCYNSPYREHLISEIKEITKYDFDGLKTDVVDLTNAVSSSGIFILDAMSADGQLMAKVNVERIEDGTIAGTYYNDGKFDHSDFYPVASR